MDDVRYSELLFLQAVASGKLVHFDTCDRIHQQAIGLSGHLYVEMAVAALEDFSIRIDNPVAQQLVGRLRREIDGSCPPDFIAYHWKNPRYGLEAMLNGQNLQRLRITFRGLQRIEELRDLLRRDRILEQFGILLDLRYLRPDLQDAINRSLDVAVSVIYADMDDFGKINKKFGQEAGDVVMKAYLETIRDCVGQYGNAYRALGDEIVALIIGQGHESAVGLANVIKNKVGALRCNHKGKELPVVTASIGVASTPPEDRAMEIVAVAEERKRKAKSKGKNRVVAQ
jgi:diguanylate cyclase (GGDEF)-like protein